MPFRRTTLHKITCIYFFFDVKKTCIYRQNKWLNMFQFPTNMQASDINPYFDFHKFFGPPCFYQAPN